MAFRINNIIVFKPYIGSLFNECIKFPETLSQREDPLLHGLAVSLFDQRKENMPDPVPLESGVEVGLVDPEGNFVLPEILEDILPPGVEERPLDAVIRRPR